MPRPSSPSRGVAQMTTPNQRARISQPPAATSTPESSSRHSSQNASGAAMPASAATTGRTAASLRAASALSAEVSVSTIQNHADAASAPSTSSRQWPRSCRGSDRRPGHPGLSAQRPAAARGRGAAHNIIPTATPGAPRSLERVDEMLCWQAQGESGAKRRVPGLGDLPTKNWPPCQYEQDSKRLPPRRTTTSKKLARAQVAAVPCRGGVRVARSCCWSADPRSARPGARRRR